MRRSGDKTVAVSASKFCQTLHSIVSVLLTIINRRDHAANPAEPPSRFNTSTATGPLRQHLFKVHLEEWVETCDKEDIKIVASEAREHVEAYRKERGASTTAPGGHFPNVERRKYSSEAFVDALAAFIIADDQVMFPVIQYFTVAKGLILLSSSPSKLSNLPICGQFSSCFARSSSFQTSLVAVLCVLALWSSWTNIWIS